MTIVQETAMTSLVILREFYQFSLDESLKFPEEMQKLLICLLHEDDISTLVEYEVVRSFFFRMLFVPVSNDRKYMKRLARLIGKLLKYVRRHFSNISDIRFLEQFRENLREN